MSMFSGGPQPDASDASGYASVVTETPSTSLWGLLLALIGAAGLALGMTILYNGMALIMQTEGAFVASGGPYEIAHPADDWVWAVPVSIWVAFLFGGVSIVASLRGWGVNLIALAWSALFFSLGWNFLRFGLNPPEGMTATWGWLVPGVVFWLMALWPLGTIAIGAMLRRRYLDPGLGATRAHAFLGVPSLRGVAPAYVVAQIVGIAAGIAGGAALFGALAG